MVIPKERFPSIADTQKCVWAPIFLSPIMGSPERFVIAVVAISKNEYHIESANSLNRLTALYGEDAETALFACDVALSELEASLASDGASALQPGLTVFSGIKVGELAKGEASSPQKLATNWMSSLSSLYRVRHEGVPSTLKHDQDERSGYDRLPVLVHDQIIQKHPSISKFFSE